MSISLNTTHHTHLELPNDIQYIDTGVGARACAHIVLVHLHGCSCQIHARVDSVYVHGSLLQNCITPNCWHAWDRKIVYIKSIWIQSIALSEMHSSTHWPTSNQICYNSLRLARSQLAEIIRLNISEVFGWKCHYSVYMFKLVGAYCAILHLIHTGKLMPAPVCILKECPIHLQQALHLATSP